MLPSFTLLSASDKPIREKRTPEVPQENRFLDPSATAHITTASETDLLRSVGLLVKSASTKSTNATPPSAPCWYVRNTKTSRVPDIHQDMQSRTPMHRLGRVGIPRHGSHRTEDVRASLIRHSHQMPHQRTKWLKRIGPFRSKASSLKPTTMGGVSLVCLTPDFSTKFLANVSCDNVVVPAARSREKPNLRIQAQLPKVLDRDVGIQSRAN